MGKPNSFILLVDDDAGKRYTLAKTLLRAGFEVREVATGAEALEMLSARPDLVILDVKLPDISGFEVCRRIKSDPTYSRSHVERDRGPRASRALGRAIPA
jgi:CheY-like chemotaxis protein